MSTLYDIIYDPLADQKKGEEEDNDEDRFELRIFSEDRENEIFAERSERNRDVEMEINGDDSDAQGGAVGALTETLPTLPDIAFSTPSSKSISLSFSSSSSS